MCIAIMRREPYDLHVRFALSILDQLHVHNINTEDETRRFTVRLGINTNADSLVTDINGNRNLAGAGINVAQRVMDSADGNQILVSNSVHDTLHVREKYIDSFRTYTASTKHGESVTVHQLVSEGDRGLNVDVPQKFRMKVKQEPKLTQEVAYYMAHAIRNRPAMVENRGNLTDDRAIIILLRSLARDSVHEAQATELETPPQYTYKAGSAAFLEQYEYYRQLDYSVAYDFVSFIKFGNNEALSKYGNCFADDALGIWDFRAVSEYGKRKLKEDWPAIWDEFDLDNADRSGTT